MEALELLALLQHGGIEQFIGTADGSVADGEGVKGSGTGARRLRVVLAVLEQRRLARQHGRLIIRR